MSEQTSMRAQPPFVRYGEDPELDRLLNQDFEELVTIAFAEILGGYGRQLCQDNDYRWRMRNADGKPGGSFTPRAALPRIAGRGFELCQFVDGFCAQVNAEAARRGSEDRLCWSLQRTARPHPMGPDQAVYCCTLAELHQGEMKPHPPIYHDDPGLALALALLMANGADLHGMHRELFPGRYLVHS